MKKTIRIYCLSASVAALVLALSVLGTSQTTQRLENARWVVEDNVVVITYDLLDPEMKKYEVSVVLRKQSDKAMVFSPKPNLLSGNVGIDQMPGRQKTIRWQFMGDFPSVPSGEDFYFEVIAAEIETGGLPWWSYAAGGAGIAIAAIILAGKGEAIVEEKGPDYLPDPSGVRPPR